MNSLNGASSTRVRLSSFATRVFRLWGIGLLQVSETRGKRYAVGQAVEVGVAYRPKLCLKRLDAAPEGAR